MRNPSISQQEVARVAAQLIKTGQNPTIAAVRHGLGDRGSNSTIQKYLQEWRESFKDGHVQTLPESLPEELLQPFEEIFNTAVVVASRAHQEEIGEYEAKLRELQDQLLGMESRLEAATGEIARLHDGHEKQRQTISDLEAQRRSLESSLESQTSLAEKLDRELLEAQHLSSQREADFKDSYDRLQASHREEIERFTEVVADHKARLEKEAERYDAQSDYWAKQVDQARTDGDKRVAKLEKQASELEKKIDAERSNKEAISTELTKALERSAAQRASIDSLKDELQKLRHENDRGKEEYLGLRDRFTSLSTENIAQQRLNEELKERIQALTVELKESMSSILDARDKEQPS